MSSQTSSWGSPTLSGWGNAEENAADRLPSPSDDEDYDSVAAALAVLKSRGVRKENSTDLSFLTKLLISISDVDLRKERFSVSIDTMAQIQSVAILLKRATDAHIAQQQEREAIRAQEEEDEWNVNPWDLSANEVKEPERPRKRTRQDRNRRQNQQPRPHPYSRPARGRRPHDTDERYSVQSSSSSAHVKGRRRDDQGWGYRTRGEGFNDRRASSSDITWTRGDSRSSAQRYHREGTSFADGRGDDERDSEEDPSLYWYLRRNIRDKPGVTAKICSASSAEPWYSGQFEGELCTIVSFFDRNRDVRKSFASVVLLKDSTRLDVPAEFLEPVPPAKIHDKALLLVQASYSHGSGTVVSFGHSAATLRVDTDGVSRVISVDLDNLVWVQ